MSLQCFFWAFFPFYNTVFKIVTISRALNLFCKSKLGQFSRTNESIKRSLKEISKKSTKIGKKNSPILLILFVFQAQINQKVPLLLAEKS